MGVTSEKSAADKTDCQTSLVLKPLVSPLPGTPSLTGNVHWSSLLFAPDSTSSWVPLLPFTSLLVSFTKQYALKVPPGF